MILSAGIASAQSNWEAIGDYLIQGVQDYYVEAGPALPARQGIAIGITYAGAGWDAQYAHDITDPAADLAARSEAWDNNVTIYGQGSATVTGDEEIGVAALASFGPPSNGDIVRYLEPNALTAEEVMQGLDQLWPSLPADAQEALAAEYEAFTNSDEYQALAGHQINAAAAAAAQTRHYRLDGIAAPGGTVPLIIRLSVDGGLYAVAQGEGINAAGAGIVVGVGLANGSHADGWWGAAGYADAGPGNRELSVYGGFAAADFQSDTIFGIADGFLQNGTYEIILDAPVADPFFVGFGVITVAGAARHPLTAEMLVGGAADYSSTITWSIEAPDGYSLVLIPEPASAALMALGIAVAGIARRFRKS